MNEPKKRKDKLALFNKIVEKVYNTRNMISLHYFDREIEFERCFTQFERLLLRLVKQNLQKAFFQIGKTRKVSMTKQNKFIIPVIDYLKKGKLLFVVRELREFSTNQRKIGVLFVSFIRKNILKEITRSSKIFNSVNQGLIKFNSSLNNLIKKQEYNTMFSILNFVAEKEKKPKVKIYETTDFNSITKRKSLTERFNHLISAVTNNYTSYQHKRNDEPEIRIIEESFQDDSKVSDDPGSTDNFHITKPNLLGACNDDKNYLDASHNKSTSRLVEIQQSGNFYDYVTNKSVQNSFYSNKNIQMVKPQEIENAQKFISNRFLPITAESGAFLEYKKAKAEISRTKTRYKNQFSSDERNSKVKSHNEKEDGMYVEIKLGKEKTDELKDNCYKQDDDMTLHNNLEINNNFKSNYNNTLKERSLGMMGQTLIYPRKKQIEDDDSNDSYDEEFDKDVSMSQDKPKFTINKMRHYSFKPVEPEQFHNELMDFGTFSMLQNFAVLLNFFVYKRIRVKYFRIFNVLKKVKRKSKILEKVRNRIEYIVMKKNIKDFRSMSLFKIRKTNTAVEFAENIRKNYLKKVRNCLRLMRQGRRSDLSSIKDLESLLSINKKTSYSRTNRLISRIQIHSNDLTISDFNEDMLDNSYDELEKEYDDRVKNRKRTRTSFYTNLNKKI